MRVERSGPMIQPRRLANHWREEPVSEAKPFNIPKQLVWKAYRQVKANRGAAGVDGQSLAAFEENLEDNLYKIWNRMASGCYFPPPVRLVEIPKGDGGTRAPGIPTVADRWGKSFTGFLPAISGKAAKAIRTTIRQWRISTSRTHQRLEDIARLVNPSVRGWLNYYGRFYRSACAQLLMRYFDQTLTAWARRKFKRLRGRKWASMRRLERTKRRAPKLFCAVGAGCATPRLAHRSRMRRESHVRFCEGGGV
jgi:Group II intron, maturase-specific domain